MDCLINEDSPLLFDVLKQQIPPAEWDEVRSILGSAIIQRNLVLLMNDRQIII
jgi:hypothetical protein